jgi:hypothetical protein
LLVSASVHSSNARKQVIGQRLAAHLSFVPGPGGKDGSVDGAIGSPSNLLAMFQSKLFSVPIPLNEGKILHSDLVRLKPKICVYVAGVGYEESIDRLLTSQEIRSHTEVHLLTLEDIISESVAYSNAKSRLPCHPGDAIDWSGFLV